jgi:hypothetical protein
MKKSLVLELASLGHIDKAAREAKAQPAHKAVKAAPEQVNHTLHTLAVKMASADASHTKAVNAVFLTFREYCIAALPVIARQAAHNAAIVDIYKAFGVDRKSAGIQRVTLLNNIRKIAYGCAETRGTPEQVGQGAEVVLKALKGCNSIPALKVELSLLKTVKHGATGKAKTEPKAVVKAVQASTAKASDIVIPAQPVELLHAVDRILQAYSTHVLTLSVQDDVKRKAIETCLASLHDEGKPIKKLASK